MQLIGCQCSSPFESFQGLGIAITCLERQPQIEEPVRLIRVDRQRLAKFMLRLRQPATIEEIEGSISMLLGSLPIIHREGLTPTGHEVDLPAGQHSVAAQIPSDLTPPAYNPP